MSIRSLCNTKGLNAGKISGKNLAIDATGNISLSYTDNGSSAGSLSSTVSLSGFSVNALSDVDTATAANASVAIYTNGSVGQGSGPSGGSTFPLASQISVPYSATLIVSDKATSFYLMEGNSVVVTSGDASSSLTFTISYEDIS